MSSDFLSVLSPYAYITPISLILLTFVAGSLIIAVCFSFTKYNIITPAKFNGLFNYRKLLRDDKLKLCIMNTVKISVMAVPLQILTSTVLASLIAARKNTFLGKFAKAALFIPVLSSSAVVGTIWKAILNGGHPAVKFLFGLFGIDPTMLLGSSTSAIGPSMSTTTMVMYAYQLTFKGSKAGYAMTVSNVLMLMVLVVVLFQQRFMRREASEI